MDGRNHRPGRPGAAVTGRRGRGGSTERPENGRNGAGPGPRKDDPAAMPKAARTTGGRAGGAGRPSLHYHNDILASLLRLLNLLCNKNLGRNRINKAATTIPRPH